MTMRYIKTDEQAPYLFGVYMLQSKRVRRKDGLPLIFQRYSAILQSYPGK